MGKLLARLRALARRRVVRGAPLLKHGNLVLDPARHSVVMDGEPVALSKREFALLELFLTNRGHVVTRRAMEDHLYGWEDTVSSNTIEVYVHNLRWRLGSDLIQTVRGVGYIVDAEP